MPRIVPTIPPVRRCAPQKISRKPVSVIPLYPNSSRAGWSLGIGELLTLACAIFFAVHIVGLGEWSAQYEAYGFALIQIATVAVITLLAALPGGLRLPPDAGNRGTVGITAVFATALAFLVQTWTQSLVPAVAAAVIMTMEPVFAGIFRVFFGKNHLTPQIIFGAVCVLTAMLVVAIKS